MHTFLMDNNKALNRTHENPNPSQFKKFWSSADIHLTNITKNTCFVAKLTNEVYELCTLWWWPIWRQYSNMTIFPRFLYNAQCVGRNYNVTFYDYRAGSRKLPLPNFATQKSPLKKKLQSVKLTKVQPIKKIVLCQCFPPPLQVCSRLDVSPFGTMGLLQPK